MKRLFALLLGGCLSAGLYAADATLKPFVADSLSTITDQREGQPFVLILWSVDCPPCLRELATISKLDDSIRRRLVLISADDTERSDQVSALLAEHGLLDLENWIFSDPLVERSRYRVDPDWYGELPRAYFYDASHQRKPHSGMIPPAVLEAWLSAHQTMTFSKMEPQ
jgi:thiol-disulfide isomerase/thioredoxin